MNGSRSFNLDQSNSVFRTQGLEITFCTTGWESFGIDSWNMKNQGERYSIPKLAIPHLSPKIPCAKHVKR